MMLDHWRTVRRVSVWGSSVSLLQDHFEATGEHDGPGGRRRSAAVLGACQRADLSRLKTRALEVLVCVMAGDSNVQIAERLGLSVSTVKYHLTGVQQDRQYIFM